MKAQTSKQISQENRAEDGRPWLSPPQPFKNQVHPFRHVLFRDHHESLPGVKGKAHKLPFLIGGTLQNLQMCFQTSV